jgi:hypothetical protein
MFLKHCYKPEFILHRESSDTERTGSGETAIPSPNCTALFPPFDPNDVFERRASTYHEHAVVTTDVTVLPTPIGMSSIAVEDCIKPSRGFQFGRFGMSVMTAAKVHGMNQE